MRFYVLTGVHKDDLGIGGQGQSDVSKNVQRQRSARQRSRVSNVKSALLAWRDDMDDAGEYKWTPIRKWRPKKAKRRTSKRRQAARRKAGFLS